jgi:plasmid stabilization system protein ParE
VKIEIGKRARRQVERANSWWEENRPVAPSLFEEEFEEALERLVSKPNSGLPHPTPKRPSLRRLLLPKTEYHLYFALERDETVLVIHSLWGARRGRGPKL